MDVTWVPPTSLCDGSLQLVALDLDTTQIVRTGFYDRRHQAWINPGTMSPWSPQPYLVAKMPDAPEVGE